MTPMSEQAALDFIAPVSSSRTHNPSFEGNRPAWWWTGKSPENCAGWTGTHLTSLSQVNLETATRQDVLDYFDNTWTLTEQLFSALQHNACFYMSPYHQLRHPLVFYYGHVASLYINKLRLAGLLREPINAYYEALFETGVDEMSWDDLSATSVAWPEVREVTEYRRKVYATVRQLIETHEGLGADRGPITQSSPLWALVMAFDHERIHLETSSVLMREMPQPLLLRPDGWIGDHPSVPLVDEFSPVAGRDYPRSTMVEVEAGRVVLGKPRDFPSFGWDNEYGEEARDVAAFSAGSTLVSNGEFLEFVQSGGYRERRYWTEDGWGWRAFRNAKWPTFWTAVGPANLHQYRLRTMFDLLPMPWSWPAEVNVHEARAFCAWKGEREGVPLRITTEGESVRLRHSASAAAASGAAVDPVMSLDGDGMALSGCNLNLAFGTPSPVDWSATSSAVQPEAARVHDAMGNVWHWCDDDFHPLKGFEVHSLYDDFSTPCYDGEHHMLMGGSWVSTGDEASVFARFHFRPHFFQHAGFRVVSSAEADGVKLASRSKASHEAGYESGRLLDQYLNLHFGEVADVLPYAHGPHEALHFPQRCAQLVERWADQIGLPKRRALDIGCAVGGSTFELAHAGFGEVVGVDLSASFIEAAQRLQIEGRLPYWRADEGELGERRFASLPDGDKAAARAAAAIHFRRADACALSPELMNFDACLIANLFCRLPSPKACLGRLGGPRGLVRPGGLAVLVSPYSWLDEHTPRGAWLGGKVDAHGAEVRSRDTLLELMGAAEFELLAEEEMPLVIREHARKFQYIVSHAMVFRRKEA